MSQSLKTVFVLSAGFTRAFLPDAPLLEDGFKLDDLLNNFGISEQAKQLLQHIFENEAESSTNGRINIEPLVSYRIHSKVSWLTSTNGSVGVRCR